MHAYKELGKIIVKYSAYLLSNVGIHFFKLLLLLALSWTEQFHCSLNQTLTGFAFQGFLISIIRMTWYPLLIMCHRLRNNIPILLRLFWLSFLVECHFSFFRTDLFLVDNIQDCKTFALWKRKTWPLLILPWCKCLQEILLFTAFYSHPPSLLPLCSRIF